MNAPVKENAAAAGDLDSFERELSRAERRAGEGRWVDRPTLVRDLDPADLADGGEGDASLVGAAAEKKTTTKEAKAKQQREAVRRRLSSVSESPEREDRAAAEAASAAAFFVAVT